MARTVSQIRVLPDANVRWVLFIEGIQTAFTNDISGDLTGSGASSWIGLSEASIGGDEVVGTRIVRQGLRMPPQLRESTDVKDGQLEPNPASFQLDDIDDILSPLFARSGKDFDVLGQRIAPGTAVLPASVLGAGGAAVGTLNRHIGLERIGPAGERRSLPPFPFSLVGIEHAVHQDGLPGDLLPPIRLSDDPIEWTGRWAAAYMVYRDETVAPGAGSWPTWEEQQAAGGLLWWGKIRGIRRVLGRRWELSCHSRDSLLRRPLNNNTTSDFRSVQAELDVNSSQALTAIVFSSESQSTVTTPFNGTVFDRDITTTLRADIIGELSTFIDEAFDGSDVNYTPGGGNFDAWSEGGTPQDPRVGIDSGARVFIRKIDASSDFRFGVMYIALHSRVWRQLGYDPEAQNHPNGVVGPDSETQIEFRPLESGQVWVPFLSGVGVNVPTQGFWEARITTVALSATEGNLDNVDWDNGGSDRYYAPAFQKGTFTLHKQGAQVIRMATTSSPYIEGSNLTTLLGVTIDGQTVEKSRNFALRGKILRTSDGEPEDLIQVVRAMWVEDNFGTVSSAGGAQPAFFIDAYLDPRSFGFEHARLDRDWIGGFDQAEIEIVPLADYAFFNDDSPEFAHNLIPMVLISSGTGSGFPVGGFPTAGDNGRGEPLGIDFFSDDHAIADKGLGIPEQLVAGFNEFRERLDENPGGSNSPVNRVRHAYIGPFLAQDFFASLMRPRRLMWRLHGNTYSVVRVAPFSPEDADLTINELDLYPDSESVQSLIPISEPAPVGQLDGVDLGFRWRPDERSVATRSVFLAKDPGVRGRTGELIEKIEDAGMLAPGWYPEGQEQVTGVPPFDGDFRQMWQHDAPQFFSLDHFSLTINVSRPKGQDLAVGTRLLINNPWPPNGAGDYGILNHVGVVTEVDRDTSTHAARVNIFVFAGQAQGLRLFAPEAKIVSVSGNDVVVQPDELGHGNAALRDYDGLDEPFWSSVGDQISVVVLIREGLNWSLGGAHVISSVNRSTDTITLATPIDESFSNSDRWLLPQPHNLQGVNDYPRTIFGPIVRDDLTHGPGSDQGEPFH